MIDGLASTADNNKTNEKKSNINTQNKEQIGLADQSVYAAGIVNVIVSGLDHLENEPERRMLHLGYSSLIWHEQVASLQTKPHRHISILRRTSDSTVHPC